MIKNKFILFSTVCSITFLSSSCNTIKNQNNYSNKVDDVKKDEEKSKIDILKVSKIRNLVRNQRIENLKKPQKSNIIDYLDINSNDNNEFYKNNYIVIKTFDEFEKIMYKNSTLDKIDKTTLLYQNVKNYKKDNQFHTFLKNKFENQFLNNISVEQILKNNNIF
ncbi:Uncharacterised protein [Mycoplasmopsis maculosa]|uniref:Lipoprotein n=1 Tax=Mycoplasmopsis maculosa TaxID=114885 RepID=A0A449B569_9BACT|nr:hypothetical protein [Mycoplasmopsis maculosa]VEU75740.1 Uncharacterised protein [Mycoplasmopsis maculosa]